jgi:hypothetical protein
VSVAIGPAVCYLRLMPSRSLSTADLTAAWLAYEAGASYRELGARFGTSHSTIRVLLTATGVQSRPVGFQPRQLQPEPPQPRSAVAIVSDITGRLRIPWRTAAERRLRRWTAAELQAIAVELRVGRVQRVRRGRSAYSEGRRIFHPGPSYAFVMAMKRLKAAA